MVIGLACCGGLFVAPGCTPAAAPPALAAGEKPVTGVPRFDRLFADVHAALVAVQEARSEEAEARGALARRLGLSEAAPIDVLGARLRERTERLAREGLTLELEFTGIDAGEGVEPAVDANAEAAAEGDPNDSAGSGAASAGAAAGDAADEAASDEEPAPPTATLRTPGREPLQRELRLLEALAQAALSGATVYTNMGRERRRIERLLVDVAELEGRVDESFVSPGDRERVRAKLREARELLPQLNAQAREVSAAADTLISLLDEAANTAPVTPQRRRAAPSLKDPAPRPAPNGGAPFGATRPAAPKSPGAAPHPSAPPAVTPAPSPAPPAGPAPSPPAPAASTSP